MEQANSVSLRNLNKYSKEDREMIKSALILVANHSDKNGAQFKHAKSVAQLLIDNNFDRESVCAALIYQLVSKLDQSEIINLLGAKVFSISEGVNRLDLIPIKNKRLFFSKQDYYAERVDNYRKLLVSFSNDLRVLIIKLFIRLDQVNNLEELNNAEKTFFALETIEIYAQIAERIGLSSIKSQLEDSAFPHAYPDDYRQIKDYIPKINQQFIPNKVSEIQRLLSLQGVATVDVYGRVKHLYSIHKKIKEKYNFKIDKFYDLFGIRIIVHSAEDCYKSLGIIHSRYNPIQERIIDMIATPKENGYQSLHTTVTDKFDQFFEVQIRTAEMHQRAEFGPAAHWHYKNAGESSTSLTKNQKEWLQELQKAHKISGNREFLDFVNFDLFSQKIFAYTPKGDIINLPKGATVLDFAFSVHSKLGIKCKGAKINEKLVSLQQLINNADTVEIISSPQAKPNIDWLRWCKTTHAKQKIKRYLKEQNFQKFSEEGRRMFIEYLKENNLSLISDSQAKILLSKSRLPYKTLDDLMVAVNNKAVSKFLALKTLYPDQRFAQPKKQKVLPNMSENKNNIGVRYKIAQCCKPVSSNKIIGYIGKDHIIKIHQANCKLLKRTDTKRHIFIDPFDIG